MTFEPDKADAFLTLFHEIKGSIRCFEGCERLELWQDLSHRNVFTTFSVWKDEISLERYRHSELFKQNWRQAKALFKVPAVAYSFKEVESV